MNLKPLTKGVQPLRDMKDLYIARALLTFRGKREQTADALGISLSALSSAIKRLDAKSFGPEPSVVVPHLATSQVISNSSTCEGPRVSPARIFDLEENTKVLVYGAMVEAKSKRHVAARSLGVAKSTLCRYLDMFGLAEEFRMMKHPFDRRHLLPEIREQARG